VKGPAGCFAFLLGSAVVFVLLLPAAGGRVIDLMLERSFAAHHQGTLELGDAWLGSFYGDQRVERLILRDPNGEEVAHGSLWAPTLAGIWNGPVHRFGPVRIRIDVLRVLADDDGRTNLERALEPRGEERDPEESSSLATRQPFTGELELWIQRLRYSDENGRELLLENLVLRGSFTWGPDETRLVLEGGTEASSANGPMTAHIELARPEDGYDAPWNGTLAFEGAPTVLARALCAAVRPLAARFGTRIDSLQWTQTGSERGLLCTDEGVRLAWRGSEVDGVVSGSAPLELDLPCASPAAVELLAALLPPLAAPRWDDPAAVHHLWLHDFRWPLDGDWTLLEGSLQLGLAPGRATLAPFPGSAKPEALELLLGPQPTRLPLRAGVLDYAGLQLPLDQGWIRLDGTLALADGERKLGVAGEHHGKALERAEFAAPVAPGDRRIPEPPLSPGEPSPTRPTPPDQKH
jgi:hypothetical protein